MVQTVPHRISVSIVFHYNDHDGNARSETLCTNFPTSTLIRFSGAARRQVLQEGSSTFDIYSSYIDWHPCTTENFECLIDYLKEMARLPPEPVFVSAPVMFAHFQYGLVQAMLCLELVKASELDKLYKQDDWMRRWIMYWITNLDVLPHEVYCAWHMFRFDRVDKGILDLIIDTAASTWLPSSVYFCFGQEEWFNRTHVDDAELWHEVAKKMAKHRGAGFFKSLWTFITAPVNIRPHDWQEDVTIDETTPDRVKLLVRDKVRRDMLMLSRHLHTFIFHEVNGGQPPLVPHPDRADKYRLHDGKWILDERENEFGERIRRWSSTDGIV